MAAAHVQTTPLVGVPKAVPVDFAPGNRPIFAGGTLINTMKTWCEDDFEKVGFLLSILCSFALFSSDW